MLGVVTGLTAEARIGASLGRASAGGGTTEGAARAAVRLVNEGATALLSFGLAGGLAPSLQPGDLVVARTVLTDSGRFEADAAMTRWLGGATVETLFASEAIAATVLEKRALYDRTGAAAIDMESGAVAAVARTRNLPFAVLRAVCDPATADLPPAALAALDAVGSIAILRVLASLARRPAQLPALLRLSAQAAAARAALLRHAGSLAPFQAANT
jgi:adenosylhomocysteine nucleosidase